MAQITLLKNNLTLGILPQSQILTEGNQFLIRHMSTKRNLFEESQLVGKGR
jgi:hypothetical protein